MEGSAFPKPNKQVSKKRTVLEKTVVKVKVGGGKAEQKQKSEYPPTDSWSWRKYGQKPIKGSPYPRGYYKCSTSKGCLAKKTVERSKDDASMVIITYTTDHNHTHPGPDVKSPCNQAQKQPIKAQPTSSDHAQPQLLPPPPPPVTKTHMPEGQEEDKPYLVTLENNCFQDETEEEELVSWSEVMRGLSSAGENEFFDELGELPRHTSAPSSSSFSSFMRNFFEERMLVSCSPPLI